MEVLNRRVNVSSGKPWSSRCQTAIKGIAAAETETKSEAQTTPFCRRDRDSNIDPKRLKRFITSSIFLCIVIVMVHKSFQHTFLILQLDLNTLFFTDFFFFKKKQFINFSCPFNLMGFSFFWSIGFWQADSTHRNIESNSSNILWN
jgi:hypothetical protein